MIIKIKIIYELGDIITFYSNRGNGQITITHRIIDIKIENGKYFYSTKGDNNNTADTHYVSQDDVIGKVIFVIPKVGFIQEFILSKVGWIVVIVIPCVGIVVYDLLKVLKIAFNKKKQPKLSKKKLKAKEELDKYLNNVDDSIEVLESGDSSDTEIL